MKISSLVFLFSVLFVTSTSSAWADCNATLSQNWKLGAKRIFTVDASSVGPDCRHAVALLVVRDSKGEVQYTYSSATRDNGVFGALAEKPATDIKQMRVALNGWLKAGLSSNKNSMAKFIPWKKGTAGPAEEPPSEFPFTVDSDVSRDTYEEWRKADLPVFCFVQGMESMRCLVVGKDNAVSELGIQSFPG